MIQHFILFHRSQCLTSLRFSLLLFLVLILVSLSSLIHSLSPLLSLISLSFFSCCLTFPFILSLVSVVFPLSRLCCFIYPLSPMFLSSCPFRVLVFAAFLSLLLSFTYLSLSRHSLSLFLSLSLAIFFSPLFLSVVYLLSLMSFFFIPLSVANISLSPSTLYTSQNVLME